MEPHLSSDIDYFEPSKLGTLDYWTEYFTKDLENFSENHNVGEIWFGYESIKRIVQWILKRIDVKKTSKIIDVGCGNGMMLVELAKVGFSELTGVDFVNEAIKLASLISSQHNLLHITYQVGDLLDLQSAEAFKSDYDVILDKGFYDAICLSDSNLEQNKLLYISNIHKLCTSNALFIITSCNWTLDELNSQYSKYFEMVEAIPTSTFSFGGKSGNRETVVVYKKK